MSIFHDIFYAIPLKMRISILASLVGIPLFFSMESFSVFTFKIAKQQANCVVNLYRKIDPNEADKITNHFSNYQTCNRRINFNKSNILFLKKDMFK